MNPIAPSINNFGTVMIFSHARFGSEAEISELVLHPLTPLSRQRTAGSRCPLSAMKRREQVQRNCQCASTSRQKTHQAKADRAPRFRQCLIIAPRSSTCRVELHWRLGPGADHGRMARIAEAWDRSTAPGATSRSTISSASIRLQRLRLACRSGAQLIPILATRYGWARPGHACLWTDILNPL